MAQTLPTDYTYKGKKKPVFDLQKPADQGLATPDQRDLIGTPKPVTPKPTSQDLYGSEGLTPKRVDDGQLPTTATTANPVTVATPAPTEETVITPNYGEVQGLDQEGLQDYIDRITVKQARGGQITEQEQLNIMKAQRMLTSQQQEKVNPFTGAIEGAETQRDSDLARIQGQADKQFKLTQQEIEQRSQRQIQEAQEQGEDLLQASAQQLSFSGAGRSSFAAEQQQKVQQSVNDSISIIQTMRDAEIARAEAERNNASAEVLSSYDNYINELRAKSQEFNNGIVTEMNEYNAQNTANYQEKVNNILQLAYQFEETQVPLTEEEMGIANSYATLAVDNEGNLNETLLKQIPANMIGAVIKKAAEIRGAIPPKQEAPDTIKGPDGAVYAWDGQGFNRVIEGEAPEPEKDANVGKTVKVGDEVYQYNPETYKYDIPVGADNGTGTTGDLRHLASQFPGQARAKNNNPAGITWNGNFDNPHPGTTAYELDQAGVAYEKGTARPASEGGYYVTFPTIEDGLKAQRIIMEKTYGNSTVESMLGSRVGTGEASNYATQVSSMAGVDKSKRVSDLTEDELARLQQSKIEKESPGLGRLLKEGGGIDGGPKELSSLAKAVIDGELKMSQVKDNTESDKEAQEVMAEVQKFREENPSDADVQNTKDMVNLVDALKGMKRRKRIGAGLVDSDALRGAIGGMRGTLSGGSVDLKSTFDQLKNTLTAENLINMKARGATFGALSQEELRLVADSASRLRLDMSDEEWNAELTKLQEQIERGMPQQTSTGDKGEVVARGTGDDGQQYVKYADGSVELAQ